MNCENVDIKKLLQKAEEYDKMNKKLQYFDKGIKK